MLASVAAWAVAGGLALVVPGTASVSARAASQVLPAVDPVVQVASGAHLVPWAAAKVLQAAVVQPAGGPLALAVLAFVAACHAWAGAHLWHPLAPLLAGSGKPAVALQAGSVAMLLAQPAAAAPLPQVVKWQLPCRLALLGVPKKREMVSIIWVAEIKILL